MADTAVVEELYRRREQLPADKRAVVEELYRRQSASAATAQPAPAPRTLGDSASDFAGAAFSKVNPVTAIEGMAQTIWSPVETAKNVLSAQGKLASEAHDAFKKG